MMSSLRWLLVACLVPVLTSCGAQNQPAPDNKGQAKTDKTSTPPADPAKEPEKAKTDKPAAPATMAEAILGNWEMTKETDKAKRIDWSQMWPEDMASELFPADKPLLLKIQAGMGAPTTPTRMITFTPKGKSSGTGAVYKIIDPDTMEVEALVLGGGNRKKSIMKVKVKVVGDEMTLSDEEGKQETYKRLPPVAVTVKITEIALYSEKCAEVLKKELEKVEGVSDLAVDLKERFVFLKLKNEEKAFAVYEAVHKAGMEGRLEASPGNVWGAEFIPIFPGMGFPGNKKEIVLKDVHACCEECQQKIVELVKGTNKVPTIGTDGSRNLQIANVTFEGEGPKKTVKITGKNLNEGTITFVLRRAGIYAPKPIEAGIYAPKSIIYPPKPIVNEPSPR